jgi:hypothetical protein
MSTASTSAKPFFIEARQFVGDDRESSAELIRWVRAGNSSAQWIGPSVQMGETIGLRTIFGVAIVSPGDWIVKGINGNFYPVKPTIFSEMFAEKLITQGDKVVANV